MDSSNSDSESRVPDSIHPGPRVCANTDARQSEPELQEEAELKNALLAAFGDDALDLLDEDDDDSSELEEEQLLEALNHLNSGSSPQNNDRHTNESEWASKLDPNFGDSKREAWVKQLYRSIYCPNSPNDVQRDLDQRDLDQRDLDLGDIGSSRTQQDDKRILPFCIGNNQFAVAFNNVVEVCRSPKITSLPLAPGWLRGVINLHGQIMSVTDLRGLFDLDHDQQTIRQKLVVLCDPDSELTTAIIVDHIGGIRRNETTKDSSMPREFERFQEILTGWTAIDSRPTALINCQKLFNHQSMGEFVC